MRDAPIPGESLTSPPKNYPWERPPEITDPEQVIQMHLIRLQDKDRMESVLDALEFGAIDLYSLVKGLMRSAVANGIHTIDTGLIAAPVVHEYIKRTADAVGIDYDEGIESEERSEVESQRVSAMAQKKLEKMNLMPKKVERVEGDSSGPLLEEIDKKPEPLVSRPTKKEGM